MDDKCIMENLLLTTKGVCDLYMHGTIEASTANVHQTFNQALNDSLCMQDDIYKEMSAKGWYQMEQAEQQKIMKVKNNQEYRDFLYHWFEDNIREGLPSKNINTTTPLLTLAEGLGM